MRVVVAISGASGVKLGRKLIKFLPLDFEIFTIYTENAKVVLEKEEKIQNETLVEDLDIGALIASGSFKCDCMAIVPTSMNTLAKISCGIADNLTTRVAQVMIKEKRKLLLAPREMPFSEIALENMLKLSRIGVIIAPPILGYYSDSENLEDMENFLIGKWLDMLGVENEIYKRWQG